MLTSPSNHTAGRVEIIYWLELSWYYLLGGNFEGDASGPKPPIAGAFPRFLSHMRSVEHRKLQSYDEDLQSYDENLQSYDEGLQSYDEDLSWNSYWDQLSGFFGYSTVAP